MSNPPVIRATSLITSAVDGEAFTETDTLLRSPPGRGAPVFNHHHPGRCRRGGELSNPAESGNPGTAGAVSITLQSILGQP
jgi:hypothetical protein